VTWEETPTVPLWYWVRVEERDVATEPGRILASTGPDLHVPGAPLEVKLGNVDNGKNRVVIVDTRLHPDPAEPVVYYGLSEPFEIRPGLRPDAPIVIHMNPPKPGVVSPITVEPEAFARDVNWEGTFIKETGITGARNTTLRFTLVGAAAVKISNDPAFIEGVDSYDLSDPAGEICETTPSDDGFSVSTCVLGGWDFTRGVEDLESGIYSVWVKPFDAFGYASEPRRGVIMVDADPPRLAGLARVERCDDLTSAILAQNHLVSKLEYDCTFQDIGGDGAPLPGGAAGPLRVTAFLNEPHRPETAVMTIQGRPFEIYEDVWNEGIPLTSNAAQTLILAAYAPDGTELQGPDEAVGNDGRLWLTVEDLYNNQATLDVGFIFFDFAPPPPPAVDVPGLVRYHRIPWGSTATDGAAVFAVEGAPGAAEPGTRLAVYDGPDPDPAPPASVKLLGETMVREDGSFGGDPANPGATPLVLMPTDLPQVYLSTYDAAGNTAATATPVRDVVWTASLRGKVPGSDLENPHRLLARPWSINRRDQPDDAEVDLFDTAEQSATVAGGGRWERFVAPQDAQLLAPRTHFASAWDDARDRVVLFGGRHAKLLDQLLGDTLEWTGVEWVTLDSPAWGAGIRPGLRAGCAAAYHAPSERTVLFGGEGANGQVLDDTWEWDGTAWTLREPADGVRPPPRRHHVMCHDAKHGLTLVHGGEDAAGAPMGDLWAWDGQLWTLLSSPDLPGDPGPGAVSQHAMAYDGAREVAVLFGFHRLDDTETVESRELWEWDGAGWSAYTVAADPATPSRDLAMADGLSTVSGVGGRTCCTQFPTNEEFTWNGQELETTTASPAPPNRAGHGLIRSDLNESLIMVGGSNFQPPDALDVWERKAMYGWTLRAPLSDTLVPGGVYGHGMHYDPSYRTLHVHGGRRETEGFRGLVTWEASGETWSWNGITWETDDPAGCPPAALDEEGAWQTTLKPPGTSAYAVVPGTAAGEGMRVLAFQDGDFCAEIPGGEDGGPSRRSGHAITWTIHGLLLFGGRDLETGEPLGDTWLWDDAGETGTWTGPLDIPGPAPRHGHTMVSLYSGEIYLYGGTDGETELFDTWLLQSGAWTQVADAAAEPGGPQLDGARLVYSVRRDRPVLVGAESLAPGPGQIWEWDGSAWIERVQADPLGAGIPAARRDHALAYDLVRNRLLLTGGLNDTQTGFPAGEWWEWDEGPETRPAVVLAARFGAAQADPESEILSISTSWRAGGAARTPDPDETDGVLDLPGVRLEFWTGTTWETCAATDTVEGVLPLQHTFTDPTRITHLLDNPGNTVYVAARTVGVNGDEVAQLRVEDAEMTLRYRLPPDEAGDHE
jgi:hypothetical protein